MTVLWAERALLPEGWAENVRLEIAPDGRIGQVHAGAEPEGQRVGLLKSRNRESSADRSTTFYQYLAEA